MNKRSIAYEQTDDQARLSLFDASARQTGMSAPLGFVDRGPSAAELKSWPENAESGRVRALLANAWQYTASGAA
jgi:hypothetical protein